MNSSLEHSKPNPAWADSPYSESGMVRDGLAIPRLRDIQKMVGRPIRMTIETAGDGLVVYLLEEKD